MTTSRVLIPLAATIVVLGGTLAAAAFFRGDDSGQAAVNATSFCFAGGTGRQRAELLASFKSAEPGALRDANGTSAARGDSELHRALSFGATCPQPFSLPQEAYGELDLPAEAVLAAPVHVASPFNVKVFIVDSTSPVLRGRTFRRLPYELVCEEGGRGCAEVSTAIYVPASAVADVSFARRLILEGLGVRGLIENPSGHGPEDDASTKPAPADGGSSSQR